MQRISYGIDDLTPFRHQVYMTPVIRHLGESTFLRAADDKEYHSRLIRAEPLFVGLPLSRLGMVLAGEAAGAILMASDSARGLIRHYSSYELSLVGHDTVDSVAGAINELGVIVNSAWGGRVEVYRTLACVSFIRRQPWTVVRVHLRRYISVYEVVAGADVGSCAVAWDGDRVFLSSLGKMAAEHGANVFSPGSPLHEERISRAFNRGGFIVIIPPENGLAGAGLMGDGLKVDGRSNCLRTHRLVPATAPAPARHRESAASLLLQNAAAAAGGRTADLTAYADGASPEALDVRALEPSFDGLLMAELVSKAISDWEAVDLRTLGVLLGADRAVGLVAEALDSGQRTGTAGTDHGLVAQACADSIRDLSARGKIPFVVS